MTYPNDSGLLCKLGKRAKRAADYLNKKLFEFKINPMEVNIKGIKSMARRYFFLKKNATQEEKNNRLCMLLDYVFNEVRLVISNSRCMGENFINAMPWNRQAQIKDIIQRKMKK
jgi:hypothetical protein